MPGLRQCSMCGQHKLPDLFSPRSARCKPCAAEVTRKWAKDNPDRTKAHQQERKEKPNYRSKKEECRIKYRYGISIRDRDEIFATQDGKCAICKKPFICTPHIDHDHATGKIRGLLCDLCNRGLGYFKDDMQIFRWAAEYLERQVK